MNIPAIKFAHSTRTLLFTRFCRNCQPGTLSTLSQKNDNIRVRFAPSPTGDLHLGGLRTAFYNYLFARKNNGVFVLRCEDTDQTRLVPGAMNRLIDLLTWFGVKVDEGPEVGGNYGPYNQSERLGLYRKWVDYLLDEGHAYKCFCSAKRLELLKKEQAERRETHQGYDNLCRTLTKEQIDKKLSSNTPYVIRFKLDQEPREWTDLVYGHVSSDIGVVEGDPILLKSDGYPTYHLANVVDDHHMDISHVLRGVEWHSSTAKHLQLFSAFGWRPPHYAHLPLLLHEDGTKLSKRQDALQLRVLKDKGYEPESIMALLSLFGGGVAITHDKIKNTGVSMQKAIDNFSLDNIRTDNSMLTLDRLPALNQACVIRMYNSESEATFCSRISEIAKRRGLDSPDLSRLYRYFLKYSDRVSTLSSLFEGAFLFMWRQPSGQVADSQLNALGLTYEDCARVVSLVRSSGDLEFKGDTLKSLLVESGMKKVAFYKLLRVVITGHEVGAPIGMMLDLLHREEINVRCDSVLSHLNSM